MTLFDQMTICAAAGFSTIALIGTAQADPMPDPLRYGSESRYVKIEPFLQFDGVYRDARPRDVLGRERGLTGEVRRARIYTDFAYDDLEGRVTLDFANLTGNAIPYAYLAYDLGHGLTIKGGQQDVPFSLENITGSRAAVFSEDAASVALAPDTGNGLVLQWRRDGFTLTGGAFVGDLNDRAFDEGATLASRVTVEAWHDGDDAVHLGLGLLARLTPRQPLSFSGDPGTRLVDTALVSTQDFAHVRAYQAANLEAAATLGRFFVQGELTLSEIEERSRNRSTLRGGYLYAGLFVTDDHRPYQGDGGQFLRVDPRHPVSNGGPGAVELAARVQFLDLDDVPDEDGTPAGRQVQMGVVANWYLTEQIRTSLDYTYTTVKSGQNAGVRTHAGLARVWFVY